jgi:hypothetical protein
MAVWLVSTLVTGNIWLIQSIHEHHERNPHDTSVQLSSDRTTGMRLTVGEVMSTAGFCSLFWPLILMTYLITGPYRVAHWRLQRKLDAAKRQKRIESEYEELNKPID